MSTEERLIRRNRNWADPSGRQGDEPWTLSVAVPSPYDAYWDSPAAIDPLRSVIDEALARIAGAEYSAVLDTCTFLKATIEVKPHAVLMALMEEGRLVPVTVPCLRNELTNQLGRKRVGEGEIRDQRRLLAKGLVDHAAVIGTPRDSFRDVHAAMCLRDIRDPADRAAVAATWRARSLRIPLVTDDRRLREEASSILGRFGIAAMRPESFLDSLGA